MSHGGQSLPLNTGLADTQALEFSTAGQSRRIELGQFRQIAGFHVSVLRGQINVWLGDYSANLPTVPHLHYYPTGQSVYVPLPCGVYALTVAGAGAILPCRATVLLVG